MMIMNNKKDKKDLQTHGYIINEKIKEESLRVIGKDGVLIGMTAKSDALGLAQLDGLDLVQINKDAQGVVTAKIMDFGKFIYEKKKIQNEAKKKTKTIEIKEIKFRPNIDVGDYEFKLNKIVEFLAEGSHVKITLQFKGREISFKEDVGSTLFERIIKDAQLKLPSLSVDYQKESGVGSFWTKVLVAKKNK